jgi:hypothetical protein
MGVYQGRGAAIGIGKESTWNSAVSRTIWRPLISADLKATRQLAAAPNLIGAADINVRNMFATAQEVGGSFELEFHYRGIGIILDNVFGTAATTGSGPYVHTYSLANAPGTGLSIELVKGLDEADSGVSELFTGCRVSQLGISASVGEIARMNAQVIAGTAAARGTAPTPALSANYEPVLPSIQGGQFSFNSVNYDLISLDVTINRGLSRRQEFGSLNTKQPTASNPIEVTATATLRYSADSLYTAQLAETQSDATITFTGNGNSAMTFTLQNCLITSASDPTNQFGDLTQTVELRALSDGTDKGISLAITNDDSTAIS